MGITGVRSGNSLYTTIADHDKKMISGSIILEFSMHPVEFCIFYHHNHTAELEMAPHLGGGDALGIFFTTVENRLGRIISLSQTNRRGGGRAGMGQKQLGGLHLWGDSTGAVGRPPQQFQRTYPRILSFVRQSQEEKHWALKILGSIPPTIAEYPTHHSTTIPDKLLS